MVSPELQKKIDRAIKLIRLYDNPNEPVEVAYSGGKDSDVILNLVKEAGINYRAIYKNTTIDPPYTHKHVKEMGVEIMQPKNGSFFELICKTGLPNRFRRFCCSKLKEYKILDKCIMGVRRDESIRRAKQYHEPTECRFYGSKKDHVEAIYPILDWSSQDLLEYIEDRGIKLHPLYYKEEGSIDITRRLGCLCCPLLSRNRRIEAFKQNPKMVKYYLRGGQIYMNTHPTCKASQKHKDVYEYFVRDLFYPSDQEWHEFRQGIFSTDDFDYKKFLEDFFKVDLSTIKD